MDENSPDIMDENSSDSDNYIAEAYKEAKKNSRSSSLLLLLIIAVVLIYTLINGGGTIVSQCDDNTLVIAPSEGDSVFIPYEQMKSVELRNGFDYGTAVSAVSADEKLIVGTYSSSELGEYTALCFANPSKCIIVKYDEGTLVFNCKNDKLTERQYDDLIAHLDPSIVK